MHAVALPIPEPGPQPRPPVVINAQCQLVEDENGQRVVIVGGVPVFRMDRDDREAEELFIAQALEVGYAKAGELAKALERPRRTVHYIHLRYVREGAAGLLKRKRGPKGPRLGEKREMAIREFRRDGLRVAEMARRLGISPATVNAAMSRMGLLPRGDGEQTALTLGSATNAEAVVDEPASIESPEAEKTAEPVVEPVLAPSPAPGAAKGHPTTFDTDPSNRSIDRMLAACGELEDAAPLFAPGENIERVGALLAVPLLVASGVFEEAEATYGSIGPAFYGLRTTLLTLLLLALLRVKRPENLKEYSPQALGRILGLDRAPEVKTVRRKLTKMGDSDKCASFLEKLVKRRIEAHSEALGFLYVDGHVRVYHGQVELPKTHVARLRMSLPATQDVWLNDADGLPVLMVTQEAHPSLTSALRQMLTDIRGELGERRITAVFDRGGWSPQLFQWMDAHGFDVLTYRKGASDPVPDGDFTAYQVQLPRGIVTYELHDTTIKLANGFEMRQVSRRQGEHQTQIVTTRRDLPMTEVAQRMFNRWCQENFFKYMREQYAIDALVEYGHESAEPEREMPNPEWRKLDKVLRKAKTKAMKLEARYGAAVLDEEEPGPEPATRGPKSDPQTELLVPLREARAEVARLLEQRDKHPRRVTVGQAKREALRLPRGRKRLSDGLKMLAYQAETDLVRAIAPHYKRSLDEGRRLIAAALQSTGDIDVVDDELRIALAPQSSPHRTRAVAELCQLLSATETRFPGTNLRMRYTVKQV